MPFSTVLSRRSSLRPGSKGDQSRVIHPGRKKCPLPAELLDRIISLVLANDQSQSFSIIAPFSLASYQFRQVALRRWFSIFKISSVAAFTNLCWVDGLYSWVRQLLCSSSVLLPDPSKLSCFRNLESVTIDCWLIGQGKQLQVLKRILPPIPSTITVLKLTALSRIDAATLRLIGGTFPRLETLELSCAERLDYNCCLDCFEDSASCIIYAPIPRLYSTVAVLGEAFASALEPLASLEHLFLGVLLSEDDLGCSLPDPDFDGHERPALDMDAIREKETLAAAVIRERVPSLRSITWGSPVHVGMRGTDHRSERVVLG
ncbi:hypothetical protein NEOLEDRAFT_797228 [Neolentinus lepideus HHB14362 ss-1]|uniref:Uncharacterized protein n=1 Tax=Neolentinus lepideus HHB14362 ss-1 TaxID=1314782 RepID=A0A165PLH2_9AGAM|nr:hypothetical protein NEOLEDRAFT_797228 [Neolentinus lepideus HHB14362 ss-1]